MERIIKYEGRDWGTLKKHLFAIAGVEKITLIPERQDSIRFNEKGIMKIEGDFNPSFLEDLQESYSIELKH
ncbi:MAG: hypothetical protein KKF67_02095 [Nanoarchaeota archaeon]|nr:hypothetical protein [Nanoarchaeota archaeon]